MEEIVVDLDVLRDAELMVVGVSGLTDEGVEFVDSYMPEDGRYVVADAGRIVLHERLIDALVTAAEAQGLSISRRST